MLIYSKISFLCFDVMQIFQNPSFLFVKKTQELRCIPCDVQSGGEQWLSTIQVWSSSSIEDYSFPDDASLGGGPSGDPSQGAAAKKSSTVPVCLKMARGRRAA